MHCSSDNSSDVDLEIEFSEGDENDDSSCTTNLSIFEEFTEKVSSALSGFWFDLLQEMDSRKLKNVEETDGRLPFSLEPTQVTRSYRFRR